MGRISLTTHIESPVETCFDLARNIDAHIRSTPGTSERAVDGVTSGLIGLGETVTWEARHLGLPWRMTVGLTAFDRPRYFVDEMFAGPFKTFRHFHDFLPDGEATTMIDILAYAVPAGWPGRLFDHLILEPYMHRVLSQRIEILKTEAENRRP